MHCPLPPSVSPLPCTRRALLAAAAAALAAPQALALAQADYPSKPIRLIVSIPPGSTTDSMLRYVAERMGTLLGQPLVVDSRPGANGVVGTRGVATAPPDGYTIGMTSNGTLSAAPYLFKNPGYDIHRSFVHIGPVAYLPYTLVVQKEVPARNLKDFLAYVRANPGKLSTGYYANSLRMAVSDFKRSAALDVMEVPYKAAPQLLTDMKLGLVHFAFVPLSVGMLGQQSDILRIMGVTTARRWSVIQDVPTLAEELPGFENVAWIALSAPAGTPPAQVARLGRALNHVLQSPETREKWHGWGADLAIGSGPDVERLVARDGPLWAQFAKEANIAPE